MSIVMERVFKVDSDRFGYTLSRLREVKKKDGTTAEEYGDATFHSSLPAVRARIIEHAMRESLAAASSLDDLIESWNDAVDKITVRMALAQAGA